MSGDNPIPPILHRSTPPPPPYHQQQPQSSSPETSKRNSVSPITHTLPLYDHPDIASSSSFASSSRPSPRRMSSQLDNTPSSSSHRTSISTAPTTPNPSTLQQRAWRPTPNVPASISRRHRLGAGSLNDEEERNRWLSEDEGLEGVARSIGRRRRRSSDENDHGGGGGSGPSDHLDPGGPGPSTAIRRSQDKAALIAGKPSGNLRPRPRRTRSFEPATEPIASTAFSSIGALEVAVGSEPPRIQDIVPAPVSPSRTLGLGIATGSSVEGPSGISSMEPLPGAVPDFASGRGGDGIGGVGMPATSIGSEVDEATRRKQEQIQLLERLRRILGCALCPSTASGSPPLHHPITLPCGHTLSADHITLPAPPPLNSSSTLPHDIFAAQQRQHQQRLDLWAGVMCPIPTCKRYSAVASVTPVTGVPPLHDAVAAVSVSSGAQRGEMLASGVHYYPPLQPAPPAYSAEPPTTETGSPLLDISVHKILNLVLRELDQLDNPPPDPSSAIREPNTDTSDSEDEVDNNIPSRGYPSSGFSAGPSSPLQRQSTKRRRNTLRSSPVDRPRSSGSPDEWPFLKELLGIVECDVCAQILYEPVTTPCQHSFCSKCLSRSLDHSSRCPLCRQDLPSFAFFQDHAVNRVILTIMKTAFPDEYAERQRAIERDERDARLDTPIFVCTLAFPGMPTILHVFEPRYRLMIRRCIESSTPRFGMVLPARGTGPGGMQGVMEYGTMLEIQSVQMLPDGRSMVETVGTHRFKLLEKGNLDGYTVGRIERIDDISPEEEGQLEESAARAYTSRSGPAIPQQVVPTVSPGPISGGAGFTVPIPVSTGPLPGEDTLQTTEEYMNICRAFIDQLRSGSAPWLLQRLNNTYGTMPTDPSEFSYWMALVMPIDEYEKARLLPIRSPRLRLKLICHWVESLRSSWWFSSG